MSTEIVVDLDSLLACRARIDTTIVVGNDIANWEGRNMRPVFGRASKATISGYDEHFD